MAVYPIQKRGNQYKCLKITKQAGLYDTVKIYCKDGNCVTGEIIYMSDDEVQVTGPYLPIRSIELCDIENIQDWKPPEYW